MSWPCFAVSRTKGVLATLRAPVPLSSWTNVTDDEQHLHPPACLRPHRQAEVAGQDEPHPDHARYIYHWIKVMKADARAIFAAAAKAQEAVAYLDSLQPSAAAQQRAA